MKYTIEKIRRKIWQKIVSFNKSKKYYPLFYKSYWNCLLYSKKEKEVDRSNFYFTARPHPGAGIGHQMANWIAGYWFAKQFELKFAHIPFSKNNWETFLGFGNDEIKVDDLLKKGYKKVRLPWFDENNQQQIALQKKIMSSYSGENIVFLAEQDQFYKNQYGVIPAIKTKFYQNHNRKKEKLKYSEDFFNIAIHVRRGDIVIGQENQDPGLLKRWQNNDYFEKVLNQILVDVKTVKPIAIYLFSQGERCDFPEFEKFSNLNFCLDWSAQDSFLHMVKADVIITSKSSFSYKPALISNGLKIVPEGFWHGYPENDNWLIADSKGVLNKNELS